MSSRLYRNIGNLIERVMKNEQQNPIIQDDDDGIFFSYKFP
ncbi:hypothetical protein [Clostridium beijerinckii]|nr:hypothetical protein [Clostridium beijerinckii]